MDDICFLSHDRLTDMFSKSSFRNPPREILQIDDIYQYSTSDLKIISSGSMQQILIAILNSDINQPIEDAFAEAVSIESGSIKWDLIIGNNYDITVRTIITLHPWQSKMIKEPEEFLLKDEALDKYFKNKREINFLLD